MKTEEGVFGQCVEDRNLGLARTTVDQEGCEVEKKNVLVASLVYGRTLNRAEYRTRICAGS